MLTVPEVMAIHAEQAARGADMDPPWTAAEIVQATRVETQKELRDREDAKHPPHPDPPDHVLVRPLHVERKKRKDPQAQPHFKTAQCAIDHHAKHRRNPAHSHKEHHHHHAHKNADHHDAAHDSLHAAGLLPPRVPLTVPRKIAGMTGHGTIANKHDQWGQHDPITGELDKHASRHGNLSPTGSDFE